MGRWFHRYPFIDLLQKEILLSTFFQSQFSRWPLVWMYHSRTLNNKIKRLHEECLRMIYNEKHSALHDLLKKDCSVSIYAQKLQLLVTEMSKLAKVVSPTMMQII